METTAYVQGPDRCAQREMRDVYWELPNQDLAKLKEAMDSFQPLFPGSNELDQIPKVHDVTGILANKALHKFRQAAETPKNEDYWEIPQDKYCGCGTFQWQKTAGKCYEELCL